MEHAALRFWRSLADSTNGSDGAGSPERASPDGAGAGGTGSDRADADADGGRGRGGGAGRNGQFFLATPPTKP